MKPLVVIKYSGIINNGWKVPAEPIADEVKH